VQSAHVVVVVLVRVQNARAWHSTVDVNIHGSHVRHMTWDIPYGTALERCVRWRPP
jgi:hypothetical protein